MKEKHETIDIQITVSCYFENDLGGQRGFQRNGRAIFFLNCMFVCFCVYAIS